MSFSFKFDSNPQNFFILNRASLFLLSTLIFLFCSVALLFTEISFSTNIYARSELAHFSLSPHLPSNSRNGHFGTNSGIFGDKIVENGGNEEKRLKECEMVVIFRTHDSEMFIEEFVAYYITQGATKIHVLDHSKHDFVLKELLPYIESGFVVHEFANMEFDYHHQDVEIHQLAMRYIHAVSRDQAYHGPKWLLSIDDDEFVLPVSRKIGRIEARLNITGNDLYFRKKTENLKEFLCRPEISKFKTVRFIWRPVGTNGIEAPYEESQRYKHNRTSLLDIERYTAMKRNIPHRRGGKTAFQINHPDITAEMWDYHGEEKRFNNRRGGPFFMHGYLTVDNETQKSFLGENANLLSACTYHFSRSRQQLKARVGAWNKSRVMFIKSKAADREKDINEVTDYDLAVWAPAVKHVIETLGRRNFYNFEKENLRPVRIDQYLHRCLDSNCSTGHGR